MDFRRKAVELYNQGKSIEEISNSIGFHIEDDTIKKWTNEDKVKNFKIFVYKLNKKQMKEKDKDKRRIILLQLKQELEKILEILPNDIDMKTKLMYTYINLGEIENAKKLGNELTKNAQSKEILNGLSIIEEKLENYDIAIEYIEKILTEEPNNEALRKKIARIQAKKEKTKIFDEKDAIYREIATLEKSVKFLIEKQQEQKIQIGEDFDKEKITGKVYVETYKKIIELANNILEKYPEEIIAREKLVKALFITNQNEEAKQKIEELLEINENDEIGLWYLSKIQRESGNIEKEKECLEKILEKSPKGSQVRIQQRLEKIKNIIEQQNEQKQLEEKLKENYTEETRQQFINTIYTEFLEGKVTSKNIDDIIEKAKKYPNFNNSIIILADIKSKITGNRQDKINELDKYIDEEYSITPEEYSNVLDEISGTRRQIEEDKEIERYLEDKDKQEKIKDSKEQREYSQMIIKQLNEGKITQENLPKIIEKLEGFKDRTRSIFLITKLYEILYDRETAYKELIKYTHISNLSDKEKERIAQMQKLLAQKEIKKGGTYRIKKIYKAKSQEENKYTKKINKEEIIRLLDEGKTVKQIANILKERGISLKSIAKVKSFYLRENEDLRKENEKLEIYARNLLKEGYKIQDVYDIMECDIPIPKLQKIEKEIKEQAKTGETR